MARRASITRMERPTERRVPTTRTQLTVRSGPFPALVPRTVRQPTARRPTTRPPQVTTTHFLRTKVPQLRLINLMGQWAVFRLAASATQSEPLGSVVRRPSGAVPADLTAIVAESAPSAEARAALAAGSAVECASRHCSMLSECGGAALARTSFQSWISDKDLGLTQGADRWMVLKRFRWDGFWKFA